jgi:hypothetical protein
MSWLKRYLPKTRRYRVYLYVLSTLLILLAADMALVQYWRRVTISYDTTRITAPLTPQGYPDYLAALNAELSKGVTPENNAAPLLARVVSRRFLEEIWRKPVFDYLGLSDLPEKSSSALVSPYQWFAQHRVTTSDEQSAQWLDGMKQLSRGPWRGADHPEWQAYVEANSAALALVHRAAACDRYYVPLIGSNGTMSGNGPGEVSAVLPSELLPYYYQARVLILRAMRKLGEGDATGFQEDLWAVLKLARLLSRRVTLQGRDNGYTCEELAQEALQCAAASDRLDRAAAERLLAALNALTPLPSPQKSFDLSERYVFLDQMCVLSQRGANGLPQMSSLDPANAAEARKDWVLRIWEECRPYVEPIRCNSAMRRGNALFDGYIRALDEPAIRRQQAASAAIDRELVAFNSRGLLARSADPGVDAMTALMPYLAYGPHLYWRTLVQRDLSEMALRLRLYGLDHGAFPEALADLGLPAAALNDRFSEQPLVYRRIGAGYILYSVGPDGKDDGGRTREEAKGMQGWDMVVRAEK